MNVIWDFFITIKAFLFGNFLKEIIQSHEKSIQELLTEIFKVRSGTAPEIMTEFFKFKNQLFDLRKNNCLEKRIIKSCKYVSETVSNLGAKLWDILPENIKKGESLQEFKKNKILDFAKFPVETM